MCVGKFWHELLEESKKHQAWKLSLCQIPFDRSDPGSSRVAGQSCRPRIGFRTKRQLWTFSGLGIESLQQCRSPLCRRAAATIQEARIDSRAEPKLQSRDLKNLFKGAGLVVASKAKAGPFQELYSALLAKGPPAGDACASDLGQKRLPRSC